MSHSVDLFLKKCIWAYTCNFSPLIMQRFECPCDAQYIRVASPCKICRCTWTLCLLFLRVQHQILRVGDPRTRCNATTGCKQCVQCQLHVVMDAQQNTIGSAALFVSLNSVILQPCSMFSDQLCTFNSLTFEFRWYIDAWTFLTFSVLFEGHPRSKVKVAFNSQPMVSQ